MRVRNSRGNTPGLEGGKKGLASVYHVPCSPPCPPSTPSDGALDKHWHSLLFLRDLVVIRWDPPPSVITSVDASIFSFIFQIFCVRNNHKASGMILKRCRISCDKAPQSFCNNEPQAALSIHAAAELAARGLSAGLPARPIH